MPEPADAVRQAAMTLLNAAPIGVVLGAMRAMLAGWETEPPTALPSRPAAIPTPPAPRQSGTSMPDPEWEALRRRVQEIRRERGLSMAELGAAIGVAGVTLNKAISVRKLPTQAMRQRLAAWLAEQSGTAQVAAPEVVVPALFHPNGSTGNGADRRAA
jgi:hypothetical protein